MKYNATLNSIKAYNEFLGGKWRLIIIDQLFSSTQRFKDLLAHIEGITPRMLTKELRSLEKYNLVEKEVYREVPPRVEYSLTDKGVKLFPLLENIKTTGDIFLEELHENPGMLTSVVLERKNSKSSKIKHPEPQLEIVVDEDTEIKFVKLDVKKEEYQLPIRQQTHSTKKRIEDIVLDEVYQEEIIEANEIDFQFETETEILINEETINNESVTDTEKPKVEKKKKDTPPKTDPKQFVQLELF